MTDPGVPHDDMLSFLWRSRMDLPPIGDEALDALLDQDRGPGETAATLRPVADVLAALRAAPGHGELTGLDPVLAEFGGAGGAPAGWHRSRPRRPALRRALLRVKVAAAVAAAVLGGGVAAAYAGVLPAALQLIAHHAIAAPAAGAAPGPPQARRAGAPAGPDPAGPAAHGLCTAYARAAAHGPATRRAVAFRNLAAAAGGGGQVAAYCATAPRPKAEEETGSGSAAGRRLTCEWLQTDHLTANGGHPSVVSFELTAMGKVTRLSVGHSHLTPGGSYLKVVTPGWPMLLSSLKSLVETGEPLEFRASA